MWYLRYTDGETHKLTQCLVQSLPSVKVCWVNKQLPSKYSSQDKPFPLPANIPSLASHPALDSRVHVFTTDKGVGLDSTRIPPWTSQPLFLPAGCYSHVHFNTNKVPGWQRSLPVSQRSLTRIQNRRGGGGSFFRALQGVQVGFFSDWQATSDPFLLGHLPCHGPLHLQQHSTLHSLPRLLHPRLP